jgi:thymidylate kinase
VGESTIYRADERLGGRADLEGSLAAVTGLLGALCDAHVSFCSWKSNEHLAEALRGETDLDLLVARDDAGRFHEVVAQCGLKMLTPPADGRHPATEHFLGFDETSGELFHVHVQYRLVLGEKYAKNYVLPLEWLFLDSPLRRDGVPVPSPEVELVVLVTRCLLKYRLRDVVKDTLQIRSPGVPEDMRREARWLIAQSSAVGVELVLARAEDVLPSDVVREFLEALDGRRAGIKMFRLRAQLRRALRPYRRRGRATAALAYARGAWLRRRRFPGPHTDLRLTPTAGGTAVALVGTDGAGKSTLVRALDDWLGWKLQTRAYYLGSKEPSRRSRALYLLFRALRRTHRSRSEGSARSDRPDLAVLATARDTVLACHCLSIGRDRMRRYRHAQRDVGVGRIVIFDRFPLERLSAGAAHRLFDGSHIRIVLAAPLGRVPEMLASIEARLYRGFRLPDHLVMLQVDPEVAIDRKPDHLPEVLHAKCAAFAELADIARSDADADVLPIDANQAAGVVLGDVKRAVWHVI